MQPIRFNTVVDQDQLIRPPADVQLPRGPIEVTVRPLPEAVARATDPLERTRSWLLSLAQEAEQAAPELPSDMAEHHDH